MPGKGGAHFGIKKKAPTSITSGKSKLSQTDLAELWIIEGGDPAKADEASAVSMAESSGIVKNGNACCKGIYALNTEVGVSNNKCAYDPGCATRYAITLSKNGTDWHPWEAWTNGHYKRFLGKSNVGTGDPVTAVGEAVGGAASALNPIKGIELLATAVEAFVKLIEHMFEASFWVRTGKGLLGAALLLFAINGMGKAVLGIDIGTAAKIAAFK